MSDKDISLLERALGTTSDAEALACLAQLRKRDFSPRGIDSAQSAPNYPRMVQERQMMEAQLRHMAGYVQNADVNLYLERKARRAAEADVQKWARRAAIASWLFAGSMALTLATVVTFTS